MFRGERQEALARGTLQRAAPARQEREADERARKERDQDSRHEASAIAQVELHRVVVRAHELAAPMRERLGLIDALQHERLGFVTYVVFFAGISTIAAVLIHFVVEKPFLLLKDRHKR